MRAVRAARLDARPAGAVDPWACTGSEVCCAPARRYAWECQTQEGGWGLDGVLRDQVRCGHRHDP